MSEPRLLAEAYKRTRRDHSTEIAEDYVVAVATIADKRGACRLSHLPKWFGVRHASASKAVDRLCRFGLLATSAYKPICLTDDGQRLALECIDRRATVVSFLVSIGVDEWTAALDAEGIEHYLNDLTLQRFRSLAIESVAIERGHKERREDRGGTR